MKIEVEREQGTSRFTGMDFCVLQFKVCCCGRQVKDLKLSVEAEMTQHRLALQDPCSLPPKIYFNLTSKNLGIPKLHKQTEYSKVFHSLGV